MGNRGIDSQPLCRLWMKSQQLQDVAMKLHAIVDAEWSGTEAEMLRGKDCTRHDHRAVDAQQLLH